MPASLFILVSALLSIGLAFFLQFRDYRLGVRLLTLALAILFPAQMAAHQAFVTAADSHSKLFWFRLSLALGLFSAAGLAEAARTFLRARESRAFRGDGAGTGAGPRPLTFYLQLLALPLAALCFLPGMAGFLSFQGRIQFGFSALGLLVPVLQVALCVNALYCLESTYRFSLPYQRKIGRIGFWSLFVLILYPLFIAARALIYRHVPDYHPHASIVVNGVAYPVLLLGFLRYRLGSEKVSVPRDTVYTSAAVFLTGAVFLGAALTVAFMRFLRLDLSDFDRYLFGFTVCFLAVLLLGSGNMRKRITRFVNAQLYSRKYDYHAQFHQLRRAMLSDAEPGAVVAELVDNMKYAVTADDAYVFLIDWRDGDLTLQRNKESGAPEGLRIEGDSPLVRLLREAPRPYDLLAAGAEGAKERDLLRADPMVRRLGMDAVFPLLGGGRLLGIMGLRGGRGSGAKGRAAREGVAEGPAAREGAVQGPAGPGGAARSDLSYDEEDLALIETFAKSIGELVFKQRVLAERIAQKQFESFHHVASFIVHDIKNQVATLSLLSRNAERNLENPAFRQGMLLSVKSCAENLQGLVDRLTVKTLKEDFALSPQGLREVVLQVVRNSGLAEMPGLVLETDFKDGAEAPVERESLFFVVKNLVNNALDAMKGRGRLALSAGPVAAEKERLRALFGGGEAFFGAFSAYILVGDTGEGMSEDFVRERLFHPFATTKEKGVGIGLYQCKTLVEKMGGRLLCHSEAGTGTTFGILLGKRSEGAAAGIGTIAGASE